ncbi:MAG: hypothetical protein KAU01_11395 [Candidatus Cloacimonetes bacterium]|nr:hypothetical protein [Candidatus Cloacimonadota bacterium]
MKIKKQINTKDWGSFDFSLSDIKKNIIDLLIDFSLVNNRFRIGQYFDVGPTKNEKFYTLNEIHNIYKDEPYFGENYPFTYDIVRDVNFLIENNEPILIEYDTRIINRFNKIYSVFNPPITKISFKVNSITRVKGNLTNLEIHTDNCKLILLWNTLRIIVIDEEEEYSNCND